MPGRDNEIVLAFQDCEEPTTGVAGVYDTLDRIILREISSLFQRSCLTTRLRSGYLLVNE